MSTPQEEQEGSSVPTPASSEMPAVALEVSALHDGSHAAREFVAFARAALGGDEDAALSEWSVRRLRRSLRDGASLRHGVRAAIAERGARLGLPLTTRWVLGGGAVVVQASGPLALRAVPPGVVTILHPEVPGDDGVSRRRREALRRAAARGVVLHVATHAAADALADALTVARASIAVATPGVRPLAHADAAPAERSILVLEGARASRARDVLEALLAAGVDATLASSASATRAPACCVVVSPDEAFPLNALEAAAAGVPLVTARTPATTELLEGAATLVEGGTTQEFVEAAMDLLANDDARAIARAAGFARAQDFTWARRSGDLRVVVRRSLLQA